MAFRDCLARECSRRETGRTQEVRAALGEQLAIIQRLPGTQRQIPAVISDIPGLAPGECGCREWHDVDEIGRWPHSLARARASQPKSVRHIVATEPIWDRSEQSCDELTARIIAAGYRIDHAYTL